MIKVQLTSNVTLAAVAGNVSPASVSGMGTEITPPTSRSESGEMSESSVLPYHWQLRKPNRVKLWPAPAMYDSSKVSPTSTVLSPNLL